MMVDKSIEVQVSGVILTANISYDSEDLKEWYFLSIYDGDNDIYPDMTHQEISAVDREVDTAMNEFIGTRGVDSMDAVHARIEDDMIGEMIDAMNESLDEVLT